MPYKKTKEEVASSLAEHDYLQAVGRFSMQHTMVSVYSSSTVLRPPDSVIRGRWFPNSDDFAGESALLNYRTDNTNIGFQAGVGRFFEPDAVLSSCHADLEEDLSQTIDLPKPKKLKTGLTATITSRRSSRAFNGDEVTMEELATLLHHAQGNSGELPYGDPTNPHGTVELRNAPSGGGLYPIKLFVTAFNVKGLQRGTYEYLPYAHKLSPTPTTGPDQELLWKSPDFDIEDTGFALTFVYNLYDNSRKYGDGGAVFGLIEVGAILQNLHLTRTSLALAGCDQGSYDKQLLERALRLDGHTHHVVHVTVIGQED
ncbi:SagB family peptide dehydrogenase [Natronoglycomyces albus]|uniref:SagB family peptide dehydrogenase n=1 Tax=Natronoglycomyces albus TaxID=2811108 RepID=A0A895XT85_9ACTN|nr:SagB family peptide dehydrogenase [Natronoglycomyces albus]QSB06862.1 SagB family peptide dehydrogenase [Natronoglycomyces albus]